MKPPTGSARPRRVAVPKLRKKVRLDLKRRPEPEPEFAGSLERKSNFWKWVIVVALFHLLAIGVLCLVYAWMPAPPPPRQFISLLPPGNDAKGTPGAQAAHKMGPSTTASTVHHHAASNPPTAQSAATITPPKPLMPPPTLQPPPPSETVALSKPSPKPPPKPSPPKPKVKVDLTLADAPDSDKPVARPKPHPKKPVEKPDDAPDSADSTGLSREQIAEKLGEKLDSAGNKNATDMGKTGAANGHANNFSDFYASIRDQVMSQWQSPNLSDETAVNPVVQIHVERDGQVPAADIHLIQSSGNPSYDDSALGAAKSLGFLHEPLPEGCPPDIPITFKLTR